MDGCDFRMGWAPLGKGNNFSLGGIARITRAIPFFELLCAFPPKPMKSQMASLSGLAMPDPFDGSPGFLIFPVADKGAQPGKVKDKPEKDILNQTHNASPKYILAADTDILCVNSLEKGCNCQDRAINRKQQEKLKHKSGIEQPRQGGSSGYNQANHFNDGRIQFIEQIVEIRGSTHHS